MIDLWTTLIPLGLVTAFLPIQIAITILMVGSPDGLARAGAWVAGMTVVRLVQFALFGAMLEGAMDEGAPGPSPVEGVLLLLVSVFLFTSAARKLLSQPDEDAPSPRWMRLVDGVSPGRAFLLGAAVVGLSPKLWAFTLGAIGAIGEAHMVGVEGWLVFLAWVALAQASHLAVLLAIALVPDRAAPLLARAGVTLERYSRAVMVAVGLGFGAWFLLKALAAFEVI